MRKEGYYWTRFKEEDYYTTSHYHIHISEDENESYEYWTIPGNEDTFIDEDFSYISSTLIPTPDQMISMEDSRIFIDNIVNNAWEGKDWNKIQDSLNYYDIILIPKNDKQ